MHSHRIATWRRKNVGDTRDAPSGGARHGLLIGAANRGHPLIGAIHPHPLVSTG